MTTFDDTKKITKTVEKGRKNKNFTDAELESDHDFNPRVSTLKQKPRKAPIASSEDDIEDEEDEPKKKPKKKVNPRNSKEDIDTIAIKFFIPDENHPFFNLK